MTTYHFYVVSIYCISKVPITVLFKCQSDSELPPSIQLQNNNQSKRLIECILQIPSSQLSPLYPGLQIQVPMMHVPWLLQETSMHWLVGTSHSAPFQPLWHRHLPFMYCPFPLHSTGQDAMQRQQKSH